MFNILFHDMIGLGFGPKNHLLLFGKDPVSVTDEAGDFPASR